MLRIETGMDRLGMNNLLAKHRQRCTGFVNRIGQCMSDSELSGKEIMAKATEGCIRDG